MSNPVTTVIGLNGSRSDLPRSYLVAYWWSVVSGGALSQNVPKINAKDPPQAKTNKKTSREDNVTKHEKVDEFQPLGV